MQGLMKTVVRDLEKNASYLEKKKCGYHNPIIRGCVTGGHCS